MQILVVNPLQIILNWGMLWLWKSELEAFSVHPLNGKDLFKQIIQFRILLLRIKKLLRKLKTRIFKQILKKIIESSSSSFSDGLQIEDVHNFYSHFRYW